MQKVEYWSGRGYAGGSPIPAVGDGVSGRVDLGHSLRVGVEGLGEPCLGLCKCDQAGGTMARGLLCLPLPCLPTRMPPGPALSKSHHLPTARGQNSGTDTQVQRCEDILQQLRAGCLQMDMEGDATSDREAGSR